MQFPSSLAGSAGTISAETSAYLGEPSLVEIDPTPIVGESDSIGLWVRVEMMRGALSAVDHRVAQPQIAECKVDLERRVGEEEERIPLARRFLRS